MTYAIYRPHIKMYFIQSINKSYCTFHRQCFVASLSQTNSFIKIKAQGTYIVIVVFCFFCCFFLIKSEHGVHSFIFFFFFFYSYKSVQLRLKRQATCTQSLKQLSAKTSPGLKPYDLSEGFMFIFAAMKINVTREVQRKKGKKKHAVCTKWILCVCVCVLDYYIA